jgi:hypothetical protein
VIIGEGVEYSGMQERAKQYCLVPTIFTDESDGWRHQALMRSRIEHRGGKMSALQAYRGSDQNIHEVVHYDLGMSTPNVDIRLARISLSNDVSARFRHIAPIRSDLTRSPYVRISANTVDHHRSCGHRRIGCRHGIVKLSCEKSTSCEFSPNLPLP